MDISAVISQLRTYAPIFSGRVAGAAEFDLGLEFVVDMPLPAAYVIPLEDVAQTNTLQNALLQQVTERIAVIVETDARADRRGQTAAATVEATKYSIFSAILNFRIDPDRAQRGIQYAGARLLHFDRARIFFQYEFELVVTINEQDGFQVPTTPLTQIYIVNTGDQSVTTVIRNPDPSTLPLYYAVGIY